jgi:hypothetical protein
LRANKAKNSLSSLTGFRPWAGGSIKDNYGSSKTQANKAAGIDPMEINITRDDIFKTRKLRVFDN